MKVCAVDSGVHRYDRKSDSFRKGINNNRTIAFEGVNLSNGYQFFKKDSLDINYLIKFLITKLCGKKNLKKEAIPIVERQLVAFFLGLQNEKEFFEEIARKKIKGEYIMSNQLNNADVIAKLEAKKIIKEQSPWESPRFNNGILTDSAYKEIVSKVKSAPSYVLNDYEKKELLNKLAKSNYHNEDIIYGSLNFNGHSDGYSNDIDNSSENEDSIFDAILDFLDDLF